jgi:glycosyltransferase involved in cell wall biosynthesis
LNKENVGITANSNIGLAKCSGKYIALSAGDDILLPGKILAQVEWLEADENRVLCGHRVEVFSETTVSTYMAPRFMRQGSGANLLIRNGGLYASTSLMVRSRNIPPHGFEPSIPTVTDYMLCIEVLAAGGRFGYVRGTYARYRRHRNNITNHRQKIIDDVEKTLLIVEHRYPNLKKSCDFAKLKHVIFERAMIDVSAGRFNYARVKLLKVMLDFRLTAKALWAYLLSLALQLKVKLSK